MLTRRRLGCGCDRIRAAKSSSCEPSLAIAVFRRLADGSVAEAGCDFTDALPLAAGKTRNYDRRD
jgi:hypothetical protein